MADLCVIRVASLGLSFNEDCCDTESLTTLSLHNGFKHLGSIHKQFVSNFDGVSIFTLPGEPFLPGSPGAPGGPAIPGGPRIPGGPTVPGFPGGPGGPGGPGHIIISFFAGRFGFNFFVFFGLIGGAAVVTVGACVVEIAEEEILLIIED